MGDVVTNGPTGPGVLAKYEEAKPTQPTGGRPSKMSLKQAQRDLNERQLQFVVWAATPEHYRRPVHKSEFAKEIGVTEVTLWRWSKNPKIITAIRWMVMHQAGDPSRIGQIIDILFETASNPKETTRSRLEAAREFLNAVGVKQMWKNPTPELLDVKEVEDIDLDSLTDEEVWELYNERAGNYGELTDGDERSEQQDHEDDESIEGTQ